jgi:hypothetical protein
MASKKASKLLLTGMINPKSPFHLNIYVVRRNAANGNFAGARMK